ncbi:hypothetical protein GGI15_000010 [Coemansia interrupta]|uniref:Uncharacterized protein n=1 Tax=Coemansia interrupta TaxID=1126814 RepID=A0A9W8HLT5_9FUNG|nr:hypothetical protein GGI15_000010 [Coemansia interrupta]
MFSRLSTRHSTTSRLARRFATATTTTAHTASPAWRNPSSASEFTVTDTHGFLPSRDPLAVLPSYFDKLTDLLSSMPMSLPDGTSGLLHSGRLGEHIEQHLPLYDVDFIFDQRILMALHRDYSMLASAYLLEPCDIQFRLARTYGLARRVLPANIARPLALVSARLGGSPFLEHSAFTLYNYRRVDPQGGLTADNLVPIRGFSGCPAERSYVAAHVSAAQHSAQMVRASLEMLRAVEQDERAGFTQALLQYAAAMRQANRVLSEVRAPGEYASFRTFLGGSRHQPMFPAGVLYEGIEGMGYQRFLGVAQSSSPVASLSTHLFQLASLSPQGSLPCRPGVDALRPENIRGFLNHINCEAARHPIQSYALRDAHSAAAYLAAIDQVLAYRFRQWANLRDSLPVHAERNHPRFREYFDVQTRHIRDIAQLAIRTHANIDGELLNSESRAGAEDAAYRAEGIRRSLERLLDDQEAKPLPVSMIAY